MAKDSTPRVSHRSFTVRVPQDLYIRMSEMARSENTHLNQKVNQLLRLGLGEAINLDQAVAVLVRKFSVSE